MGMVEKHHKSVYMSAAEITGTLVFCLFLVR